MTRQEAETALKAAGADWVGFNDDRDFLTGIGVRVGEERTARAWNRNSDLTADAVGLLKEWLADHARPR